MAKSTGIHCNYYYNNAWLAVKFVINYYCTSITILCHGMRHSQLQQSCVCGNKLVLQSSETACAATTSELNIDDS